jgi:hypothetical protein
VGTEINIKNPILKEFFAGIFVYILTRSLAGAWERPF